MQQRNAGVEFPDLVAYTRALLETSGLPWVIENVPGAPVRKDLVLCGCHFGLPLLKRQRWFELGGWSFPWVKPKCKHDTPVLSVTGHGVGAGNGQRGRLAQLLGRNPNHADAKRAMDIDWMSRDELSQAVPPAYTEFIGKNLIEQLRAN